MTSRIPWFERRWTFDLPVENFADVLERLRGTPARLEEHFSGAPADRLTHRDGLRWSAQENLGHLLDLEDLWAIRTRNSIEGDEKLQSADLGNSRTHEARHHETDTAQLLGRFRQARMNWVERLDELPATDFARTALHPRLGKPMRLVDLCLFVAEHDHHLARIAVLLRARAK